MICPQCKANIADGSKFCPVCGAAIAAGSTAQQTNANNQQSGSSFENFFAPNIPGPNNGRVEFVDAVKLYIKNSFNFTGRASKSEYWWGFLFAFLAGLVVNIIPVIGQLLAIALAIPAISSQIRRLHDVGKPWYFILLNLIPCGIGTIILIVMYYIKDSDGSNQWGPAR